MWVGAILLSAALAMPLSGATGERVVEIDYRAGMTNNCDFAAHMTGAGNALVGLTFGFMRVLFGTFIPPTPDPVQADEPSGAVCVNLAPHESNIHITAVDDTASSVSIYYAFLGADGRVSGSACVGNGVDVPVYPGATEFEVVVYSVSAACGLDHMHETLATEGAMTLAFS